MTDFDNGRINTFRIKFLEETRDIGQTEIHLYVQELTEGGMDNIWYFEGTGWMVLRVILTIIKQILIEFNSHKNRVIISHFCIITLK